MSERDQIPFRPDVVEHGQDLLLGQFDGAVTLKNVLEALLGQVQDLEDTLFDLFMSRTLDTATGHELDLYGKLVGERRDGLSDDQYRGFIRIRTLSNISQGDISGILQIVHEMSTAIRVQYDHLQPAGYQITYVISQDLDPGIRTRIIERLEQVTVSGVSIDIIEAIDEESFGFQGSNGLGFGAGTFAVPIATIE